MAERSKSGQHTAMQTALTLPEGLLGGSISAHRLVVRARRHAKRHAQAHHTRDLVNYNNLSQQRYRRFYDSFA